MTIPEAPEPASAPAAESVIHKVKLTQEEILTAVALAAAHKAGFTSKYQATVWSQTTLGEEIYANGIVTGASVELVPLPPETSGESPIVYRIIHRAGAETIAEAAAGPTGELVSGKCPAEALQKER